VRKFLAGTHQSQNRKLSINHSRFPSTSGRVYHTRHRWTSSSVPHSHLTGDLCFSSRWERTTRSRMRWPPSVPCSGPSKSSRRSLNPIARNPPSVSPPFSWREPFPSPSRNRHRTVTDLCDQDMGDLLPPLCELHRRLPPIHPTPDPTPCFRFPVRCLLDSVSVSRT